MLDDSSPASKIAPELGRVQETLLIPLYAVAARMQWVCEDPRELEQCGLKLLQTRTFATSQPETANSWPARYRYGMPLLARLLPAIVNSYKLNLFRFGTQS
jgi:hypothetical protein